MPRLNQSQYRMQKVDDYFGRLPSSECVERCIELIENYYSEAKLSGRLDCYRLSFYDYYEGFLMRGLLQRKGLQGEQVGITVNNYHNFIKHRVSQVCQQKLSYEPQTSDGSHEAMEQVRLAKGILNLYADREDIDLDGKLRKATQYCQMFLESYVFVLWDKAKGKPVAMDTETESLVPEGDVVIEVYDPLDVVRDVYRSRPNDQWLILKEEVNKVDLAVQYPALESDIMADSLEPSYKDRQIYPCLSPVSDIIWIWTLFHARTPALPNGRMLKFVSNTIVLEDGPLPEEYSDLPGHRMSPEDLAGSPWGYADTVDLLPVCNAISRLHSMVLTNNLTFGLQHILVPNDSNLTENELGTGLTALGWDAAKGPNYKPEALNLTQSAPESYNYITTLTQTAGTLSGINEVTRGNPDLVLKGQANAEALALMSTQAIQFNSDLCKAYQSTAGKVGTAIIKILAKRSVVPRQGRMMAMSGKPYSKQFVGSDLSMIDKVVVKTGNPLAQTTAGRTQIAASLINAGWVKNHQEYLQVLETGSLDPLLESSDMEISLIKDENDALGNNEPVQAIVTDDHVTHIAEHKTLLASVESRKNPALIQAVIGHIQHHIDFLAGNAKHGPMNPVIATINNQPALPPGSPNGIVLPPPQMPPAGRPMGPMGVRPPAPAPAMPGKPVAPGIPVKPGMPSNLPQQAKLPVSPVAQ
ncbi:MAG: hypothetical protein KGL39_20005 [Patescibacteria group bacterium]|nr:hypothetical protein [Patescibacteria group bacterium]